MLVYSAAMTRAADDTSRSASQPNQSGPTTAQIPLVIGVTGHRDLLPGDVEQLEKAVGALFNDLIGSVPNTPILLVTQLAEGADRLVARVAAQHGVSIRALLPMSRSLYETDFTTQASRDEFQKMLHLSKEVTELSLPPGLSAEAVARDGPERNGRYEAAGVAVNRSCHILIALWDGERANGKGGTGDIVQFMLNGPAANLREVDDFLHASLVGPVAHIWTPRLRGTGKAHPAGQLKWLYPEQHQWRQGHKGVDQQLNMLDRYNADVARLDANFAGDRSVSLVPVSVQCDAAKTREAELIDLRYRAADRLSQLMQMRARAAYLVTTIIGLLALSFYQLNVHYHTHRPQFLGIFGIFMLGSVIIYVIVRKRGVHERFLDYRSLAESLRVQFFWRICGMKEQVIEHLVPRLRDELIWQRLSLVGCAEGPSEPPGEMSPEESLRGLRCARDYWVHDQRSYFTRRTARRKEQADWHSAITTSLVLTGLILVGMSFALTEAADEASKGLLSGPTLTGISLIFSISAGAGAAIMALKRLLTRRSGAHEPIVVRLVMFGLLGIAGVAIAFLAGDHVLHASPQVQAPAFLTSVVLSVVLAVSAGVVKAYGEHFAFAQHLRRYRTMADLFSRADDALLPLLERKDLPEAYRLVFELGRESLAENAEWFVLHRERPIELLRPG